MKKIAAIFCFLACSCSSTQHIPSYDKQMKEVYLSEFKLNYFRTLLKKGFNNSESVRNILAFDRSGFTEIIMSMEDFTLIDSLTNIDHSYLVQDSINKIGRVAEGAEGKAVLGYALNKYQSKWLDSLAKTRRKVYWRSMKEMEE